MRLGEMSPMMWIDPARRNCGNVCRLAGRAARVLAAALALAGLTGAGAPGSASPSTCAGRAQPPSPSGFGNSLNGVAVLSSCSAWAVGGVLVGSTDQTLIVHWNGTSWQQVDSPNPSSDDVLEAVAGTSGRNIWAVGEYSTSTGDKTLIAHWGGTRWRQVPSPNPASGPAGINVLYGVAALSASDAWAVGGFGGTASLTLIAHWNGTRWRRVPSPDPSASANRLSGVAALSAGNIWAVGFYDSGTATRTLVLHWNGTRWRQVPSPNPGGSGFDRLVGVAGASARNIWAVGDYYNGTTTRALMLHWNGTKWKQVASPNPGSQDSLFGVAIPSRASAVAAGYYNTGTAYQTLIVRWNGSRWRRVPSPDPGGPAHDNFLYSAAASAGTAWAVGQYSNGNHFKNLAIRCC